jgi:hypothetical protein
MALFPYNSDPKYSAYDINNSQDFRGTSKRCDYIQIGLRLYSHLFCRIFIFHYLCIYLSIMLSISNRSGTAYSSRVQDLPLCCCSILSFLSNVLYICSIVQFSFGNCIVCPSIYTIWIPFGISRLFS